MKKKTMWWLIGILGGFILLMLLLRMFGVIGQDGGMKVAVDKVSARTIVETVSASGNIYPETEVKIKADVSGEIVELRIEEGDSVVRGQLLLKINPSIYEDAVSQAEASMNQSRASVQNAQQMVAQSKAQLDRTQSNYERNKQLYQDKVISKMEFEQLEAEYLSAKANYDAALANVTGGKYGVQGAGANLSQARENLRRTTITAPTSGIISQLLYKKGERVVGTAQMDGSQILTIANLGRMEVQVEVSETDIVRVNVNDTAIIRVDAYRDQQFKGVVSKISVSSVQLNTSLGAATATASDQVTNYTVHILILPDSYSALRTELGKGKFPFKPGMSAGVEIQTRTVYDALSVPINAVTTRDWPDSLKDSQKEKVRQVVFVYHPGTKQVSIRDVATGVQDNEFIQVTESLKADEQVVIAPYGTITRLLQDKSSVQVTDKSKLYESTEKEE